MFRLYGLIFGSNLNSVMHTQRTAYTAHTETEWRTHMHRIIADEILKKSLGISTFCVVSIFIYFTPNQLFIYLFHLGRTAIR